MLVGSQSGGVAHRKKRCLVSVRGERAALGWAAVMFVAPLPGVNRAKRPARKERKLKEAF